MHFATLREEEKELNPEDFEGVLTLPRKKLKVNSVKSEMKRYRANYSESISRSMMIKKGKEVNRRKRR